MIAQHPRGGLNGYVLQALRIQQKARHLPASNPILGSDLRILCNVNFDPGLRIYFQQQTRKNEYPKKRVFKHIASRRVSTGRYHALGTGGSPAPWNPRGLSPQHLLTGLVGSRPRISLPSAAARPP